VLGAEASGFADATSTRVERAARSTSGPSEDITSNIAAFKHLRRYLFAAETAVAPPSRRVETTC